MNSHSIYGSPIMSTLYQTASDISKAILPSFDFVCLEKYVMMNEWTNECLFVCLKITDIRYVTINILAVSPKISLFKSTILFVKMCHNSGIILKKMCRKWRIILAEHLCLLIEGKNMGLDIEMYWISSRVVEEKRKDVQFLEVRPPPPSQGAQKKLWGATRKSLIYATS